MSRFTIWIDYDPEDRTPEGDTWVEVQYLSGRVQKGMAWEINWNQVARYKEEIL